ncbi:DNA topoisomerase [Brotaphodocola sp.]|uniref:DNA topoisomerase n=1 Tax=Brotaphodocola sp. TaxID=3073577 RepID=UPI003D7C61E8
MGKSLYIAEKPSVAQQFAAALKISGKRADGYIESDTAVVTWCVGHLVTMSYPEAYDPKFKRWSLETLPFLPKDFKYEVIGGVAKQFQIVAGLLNRPDVETIYICTDSGREGEYIYRLVDQMAGVGKEKKRKRVWIDSQTEEEILRGIREAKDWSEYDNLASSAYLRAKEDYLMGINFSRLLTLKYGPGISSYLRTNRTVLSVGRVMTCVLGMVVRREREIREFVKTPFYRVVGRFSSQEMEFDAEWRAVEGSKYFQSPYLYKENGFKERRHAEELIALLESAGGGAQSMVSRSPSPEDRESAGVQAQLVKIEKKKETKNPPLLYNLAELQNDCSKMFKISPDETLKVVQELYEKKLVTYPRTDARVLSTAVAKEIHRNIGGLRNFAPVKDFAAQVLDTGTYKSIAKTRYVNDKQITDHYAIVPTGQGFGAIRSLSGLALKVYEVIARRFLSVFYPPAVYQKYALEMTIGAEHFFANFKVLTEAGYLSVADVSRMKKRADGGTDAVDGASKEVSAGGEREEKEESEVNQKDMENPAFIAMLASLKKGMHFPVKGLAIREGETSPPKRYSSGSMILAMENAGQLIEDEELRAQIRGSGIGTSATRAEILKKLVNIEYLALNGKTQIITPTLLGELVFEVVNASIRQLLNPELTASWEKGLTYVAEGTITSDEYMEKLARFVAGRTYGVLKLQNSWQLRGNFETVGAIYQKDQKAKSRADRDGAGGTGSTAKSKKKEKE